MYDIQWIKMHVETIQILLKCCIFIQTYLNFVYSAQAVFPSKDSNSTLSVASLWRSVNLWNWIWTVMSLIGIRCSRTDVIQFLKWLYSFWNWEGTRNLNREACSYEAANSEGVRGSGSIVPVILNLGTWWWMWTAPYSNRFKPPPLPHLVWNLWPLTEIKPLFFVV